MTSWLLNSAVLPAGEYGTYEFSPATVDELREFCSRPGVVSRIGYPETAQLICEMTGYLPAISREPSIMRPGDEAMVVRLRYRVANPAAKGAPTGASDDQWEIARLGRLS